MTGERRIEVQAEVPGTPEQVWEAIATGPGITAWFMPAEVDGRPGGEIVHRHEPGTATPGTVTAYDPPHRFAYEEHGWIPDGEHAGAVTATEFLVEARGGGACVVRIVMSGFDDGEAWERATESFGAGWRQALVSLRLYLQHYRGLPVASVSAGAELAGRADDAWESLTAGLGVPSDPAAGDRIAVLAPGAPAFAGTVEEAGGRMLTVVLDRPAPGIGFLGAGGPGDAVHAFVRAQLFGPGLDALAERESAAWAAWLAGHAHGARAAASGAPAPTP
jgi:uncharacterized protein YndB with AHSA1/START domain